jgi:hypothetical protein
MLMGNDGFDLCVSYIHWYISSFGIEALPDAPKFFLETHSQDKACLMFAPVELSLLPEMISYRFH